MTNSAIKLKFDSYFLLVIFMSTWPLLNNIKSNVLGYQLDAYLFIMIIAIAFVIINWFIGYVLIYCLKIDKHIIFPLQLYSMIMIFSFDALFASNIVERYNSFIYVDFQIVWVILFALGFILIMIGMKFLKHLIYRFSITFIYVVYGFAFTGVAFSLQRSEAPISIQSDNLQPSYEFINKPNVYYLMLDAYVGSDQLVKQTKFDNSEFINFLTDSDFIVANRSFSNYHITLFSFGATLNLDYHDVKLVRGKEAISKPAVSELFKGNNKAVNTFKDNNYKYVYVPAVWYLMRCRGREDTCLNGKSGYIDIFESVIGNTPFRYIYQKLIIALKLSQYDQFENAEIAIDLYPNEPKFVLIHFPQLHDRVYNRNCEQAPENNKKLSYAHNVNCFNNELTAFVEKIIDEDPDAIIALQADHGGRRLLPALDKMDSLFNFFSIFSAIRIPENHQFNLAPIFDDASPVNLFRMVFAQLSDETPILLSNNSFSFVEDTFVLYVIEDETDIIREYEEENMS